MLDAEKVKTTEKIRESSAQFHKDIENLKLEHHAELKEKQTQLEKAMAELQNQSQ